MAINFSVGGIYTLKPLETQEIRKEVFALLVTGEECVAAFQTVRDQVIFTDKRIIAAEAQGFPGKRISYASLPYGKAQFFSVQTAGAIDAAPDPELTLFFGSGAEVTFKFSGNTDIGALSRMIAGFIL
ncbi:MAG: PH domain-containing protein [Clostridia bacterium]|nr:PH domain-containing protein [Clostridia bacterium]